MKNKRISLKNNTTLKNWIAFSIIIILIVPIVYYYLQIYPQTQIKRITAKEDYLIVNQTAIQWKNDSVLYNIYTNNLGQDGKSSKWLYEFISYRDYKMYKNSNIDDAYFITIYGDGKIEKEVGPTTQYVEGIISNWTSDSSDYMQILNHNASFIKWIKKEKDISAYGFDMMYYDIIPPSGPIIDRTIIIITYEQKDWRGAPLEWFKVVMDPFDGTILAAPYMH